MRTFRVAVVGCGGVSAMHFRGFEAHPERVQVVAACDRQAGRAEQARDEFGFEMAFDSLEAMIDGAEWDVAVVCTPTPVREQVVGALASAGKHVFVEKPLADSLAEAEAMVAACVAEGVSLAVDQNFRYHYPFHIARDLIETGRLGNVISVALTDMMWRQDAGWRAQCPRHAMSVMGVHWLDGFRWMLADEASSVLCRTRSSVAIDCAGETDAVVNIGFETGPTVSYVQSFSSPIRRNETLILGEAGMLVLGYKAAELFEKNNPAQPAQRWDNIYAGDAKPQSAFKALNELLTSVEGGTDPANSGRDNLKTVALLDAAYRSAADGRAVTLKGGLPA